MMVMIYACLSHTTIHNYPSTNYHPFRGGTSHGSQLILLISCWLYASFLPHNIDAASQLKLAFISTFLKVGTLLLILMQTQECMSSLITQLQTSIYFICFPVLRDKICHFIMLCTLLTPRIIFMKSLYFH